MKKFIVSFFALSILGSTVVFAGTLVKKVYFSPYPITIDGKEYSSEMPILQYQDRTYVALREFSEKVGVEVDFKEGEIVISTSDNEKIKKENNFENQKNKINEEDKNSYEVTLEIKKDLPDIQGSTNVTRENQETEQTESKYEELKESEKSNVRIVYVSKTGKKYHNLSNCNGAEYSEVTISEAISRGLTPCLRCAK